MIYIKTPLGVAVVDETSEFYSQIEPRIEVLDAASAEVQEYLGKQKPKSVTMRQGKEALIRQGKDDQVQPAIDAIADPVQRKVAQNFWDNSNAFERQNPTLIALATALGMTAADLDDLFVYASTL